MRYDTCELFYILGRVEWAWDGISIDQLSLLADTEQRTCLFITSYHLFKYKKNVSHVNELKIF